MNDIENDRSIAPRANVLGTGSVPHFYLVDAVDASTYRHALPARGIQVRDCTSYELPAYIRVATPRPQDDALLLESIFEIVA